MSNTYGSILESHASFRVGVVDPERGEGLSVRGELNPGKVKKKYSRSDWDRVGREEREL